MPSRIRRNLVDPTKVGIYHCESRCVRRAFHGQDLGGLDVSHRKGWVVERMRALASVFSIDVLDYGVQDNSLHSLLKIRPDIVAQWSDEEVVRRWYRLNRRQLALNDQPLPRDLLDSCLSNRKWMEELRTRLCSLSWFMVMLKEPLSRKANFEDGLSGHFFAERFGCQRCETLEEVVQASVFTSLSPVHAGVVASPDDAAFTSLGARLASGKVDSSKEMVIQTPRGTFRQSGERPWESSDSTGMPNRQACWLAPLSLEGDGRDEVVAGRRVSNEGFLPFGLDEYRELIAACRKSMVDSDVRDGVEVGVDSELDDQELGEREVADGPEGTAKGTECFVDSGNRAKQNAKDECRLALVPEEMPVMLERFGLDRTRWAEAYHRLWRRFARITRKTDALRRDFQQISNRHR